MSQKQQQQQQLSPYEKKRTTPNHHYKHQSSSSSLTARHLTKEDARNMIGKDTVEDLMGMASQHQISETDIYSKISDLLSDNNNSNNNSSNNNSDYDYDSSTTGLTEYEDMTNLMLTSGHHHHHHRNRNTTTATATIDSSEQESSIAVNSSQHQHHQKQSFNVFSDLKQIAKCIHKVEETIDDYAIPLSQSMFQHKKNLRRSEEEEDNSFFARLPSCNDRDVTASLDEDDDDDDDDEYDEYDGEVSVVSHSDASSAFSSNVSPFIHSQQQKQQQEETATIEEVDCNKNPTELYSYLAEKDWANAISRSKTNPQEAAIWVFRKKSNNNDDHEDDNTNTTDNNTNTDNEDNTTTTNNKAIQSSQEQQSEYLWRVLPIHAACIFRAPHEVIMALLTANPQGPEEMDSGGRLPIHIACQTGADENTISSLLKAYPDSSLIQDSRGYTPLAIARIAKCWNKDNVIKILSIFTAIQDLIHTHRERMTLSSSLATVPTIEEFMEVDYDRTGAKLYRHIRQKEWIDTIARTKSHPEEASTWVFQKDQKRNHILWRVLPIHDACALCAPLVVIEALITANPHGLHLEDDKGMLPIHIACQVGAEKGVIASLLNWFPESYDLTDGDGMLPMDRATESTSPQRHDIIQQLQSFATLMNFVRQETPSSSALCGLPKDVDYDKNPTKLYQCIRRKDWFGTIARAEEEPKEAMIWIHRRFNSTIHDINSNNKQQKKKERGNESKPSSGFRWRILPIHAACVFKAPSMVIASLIAAYPESLQMVDDGGRLPLHVACHTGPEQRAIRILLKEYPQSVYTKDERGQLPIDIAENSENSNRTMILSLVRAFMRDMAAVKEEEEEEGRTQMENNNDDYHDRQDCHDLMVQEREPVQEKFHRNTHKGMIGLDGEMLEEHTQMVLHTNNDSNNNVTPSSFPDCDESSVGDNTMTSMLNHFLGSYEHEQHYGTQPSSIKKTTMIETATLKNKKVMMMTKMKEEEEGRDDADEGIDKTNQQNIEDMNVILHDDVFDGLSSLIE